MNVIRSHNRTMFTETVTKTALSENDSKRITLANGIHTLAHGHRCEDLMREFGDIE